MIEEVSAHDPSPYSAPANWALPPACTRPARSTPLPTCPACASARSTLNDGADIHTGVTAIVPEQLRSRRTLPAGLFVGNGYGKLVGATQLVELGEIETPVLLTGTLSAFRVADALVTHMLALPGNEELTRSTPSSARPTMAISRTSGRARSRKPTCWRRSGRRRLARGRRMRGGGHRHHGPGLQGRDRHVVAPGSVAGHRVRARSGCWCRRISAAR